MRVVIFFACLCFLLFKGNETVFGSAMPGNSSCSPARKIEARPQIKTANACGDYAVVEDINLEDEEEYLISDEVEDEEANNFLARKYRLLARCYLALSDQFILSYLYKCFKAPVPAWGHLSDIYLTQRVLRI